MTHEGEERANQIFPEVLERFNIKPIQTVYGGIKFRSRIEARWAIFFDALHLTWEYEPEGFDLGDGVFYLPDFWFEKLKIWVEIKGAEPDEDACERASKLAEASGFPVFVFFGGFTMPDSPNGVPVAYALFPDGTADYQYCWCECRECGLIGIQYEGRSDRLPCKENYLCAHFRRNPEAHHFDSYDVHRSECDCESKCSRSDHGDKDRYVDSPSLVKAYSMARTMRFGR